LNDFGDYEQSKLLLSTDEVNMLLTMDHSGHSQDLEFSMGIIENQNHESDMVERKMYVFCLIVLEDSL